MIDPFPAIDEILDAHATALGADGARYRNHCLRVANLAAAHLPAADHDTLRRIGIAAAFHDLGIWTDHTFDYLEPSVRLAEAYLAGHDLIAWSPEIVAAIRQHHKLTRYKGNEGPIVEAFRRADWTDVTGGLLTFGLPRATLRQLKTRWPTLGFHRLLVKLELHHLSRHPLNPLPVFKL